MGELTALPRPLAGFKGPTSKGRGKGGKGRPTSKGKGGKGGEGRHGRRGRKKIGGRGRGRAGERKVSGFCSQPTWQPYQLLPMKSLASSELDNVQ